MRERYQVVIVGGGTAGLTVAARLRRTDPGVKVAIVEPSENHFYQPLWTLVGGGVVSKESTRRNQKDLIPRGATWLQKRVAAFDPAHNRVVTADGVQIEYDALVVAPGIQINWNRIKGLPESLGKDGVTSNYSFEHAETTWRFLNGFRGGRALFTFPSTPVKCAGAPQKIMWLADHLFRKRGIRKDCDVTFASAAAAIFAVAKYRASLEKLLVERQIDTMWQHDLIEVRGASREAVFRKMSTGDETVVKYDFLHATPPMSAPDFVRSSPLADAAGWVDVDKHTLQHPRFANIFALGDASSLPTSRTGAAIRKQAPVVVKNLLAHLRGLSLDARYDGYTSCPLVTGYGRLILAEFDYDGKPVETFPFDQSKERWSMYALKRHLLPAMYWNGMLRGRA